MFAEVRRPYSGAEGRRVRPGTLFFIEAPGKKAPAGVQAISQARAQQLKQSRLIDEIPNDAAKSKLAEAPKPEGKPVTPARTPSAKPAPEPKGKVEPDSRPPSPRAAAQANAPIKAKRAPKAGPTGEGDASSSSRAAPQTGKSTLKQRGVRRGDKKPAGSSSTTPTESAPGQTSSTAATPNGGDSTQPPETSPAFV